jgi:nitronate monooxygenase
VPVWSIGLGDPGPDMVRRCRERGVKVMAMAARLDDAKALARSGVDVIVAQGGEAGGHRSTWIKTRTAEEASVGLVALVPQIVDAVRVPVVASGGIVDGRGLVAALALGAQGILLGTRFVATRESMAPEFYKRALIERDSSTTAVTDAFTGLYARALRNSYAEEYTRSGAPVLPGLAQRAAAQDVYNASAARGTGEYFPMWAGQSVGLIHDLPGAGDVVGAIAREARDILAGLTERVSR